MWRVLVAGGGPAGLYVCRNLLKLSNNIHIDLYEKSNSLYGLLRTGVSPDKISLKSIIPSFDSTLSSPNISVHLGQTVGVSILVPEIALNYDFLILCTGALVPRNLVIPGELNGVFQAIDFCNYYNGLKSRNTQVILEYLKNNPRKATIIGNGNVSLDVAKMLLYPKESLKQTCMPNEIINTMPKLERVYVIGRGGWANAKFTNSQLSSIVNSQLFHPTISPSDYENSLPRNISLDANAVSRNISLDANALPRENFLTSEKPLNTTDSFNRMIQRRKRMIEKMVDNYGKNTSGEGVIEFIFHSNVTEISERNAAMNVKVTTDGGKVINVESNFLFKALGFERDPLTMDLMSRENGELLRRNNCHFFSVGWSRHGAMGDLSTTILQAKECAEFVREITEKSRPKNS